MVESDNQSGLPADVATVMSTYLSLVDERLPGRISGLYLIGSLALNDYRPGQSDIDFVAVSDTTLTPAELEKLGRLHADLRRTMPRPKLDGVYLTWLELQMEPTGLSLPYILDGRLRTNGVFKANPITWVMLHRYQIPLRGPARPAIRHDTQLLRRWCRENLQSYWAGWVQRARTQFLRRLYSLTRQATIWGVLGVTRLHGTIRSGDILSKTSAGAYALEVFPALWSGIIQDALAGRLGQMPAIYRNVFTRRREALAFMEYVISDAME